jgi:hypothetical protein
MQTTLTDAIKKQLTTKANAFQKGRDGLKQFVVGNRTGATNKSFGLIGEWIAPPTYKADGTIDASAISSGIQQDSILEYLGEAKDKDGNAKLLAAVSTVRGWINSSKPDEYKNTNQAGQANPAREEATEQLAVELDKIDDKGIDLAAALDTITVLVDPFGKVAFDKLAKDGKLAKDDLLAFAARTLRAAMRLVQDQQKLQRDNAKANKADDDAEEARRIAETDAKSMGEGKDGRPYNLEDARIDRDKAELETA